MKAEQFLHAPERILQVASNALHTVADLSLDQQKIILAGAGIVVIGSGLWWLAKKATKVDRAPKWPSKH